MGRAILSKSLIQFSVDESGCVPSMLFDLRPNYGGGNEDNHPGQGQRPRVPGCDGTGMAKRSYPTLEVRGGGREEQHPVQGVMAQEG